MRKIVPDTLIAEFESQFKSINSRFDSNQYFGACVGNFSHTQATTYTRHINAYMYYDTIEDAERDQPRPG